MATLSAIPLALACALEVRYYLERVLRDIGGISHWAAKLTPLYMCIYIHIIFCFPRLSLGIGWHKPFFW